MFMAKYAVVAFLLPPGIFISVLLLSSIVFLLKKNWTAGVINFLIACLMWSLTIMPVSNAVMRSLESGFDVPENPQGDVIILLGGGVADEAPDLSGIGAPSEPMIARIVTAVRLQKRLEIPIIISGGTVFKHIKGEAPIVKRFLVDLGVPPNMIIMENKSRDTRENARFSGKICVKSGYRRPLLVTSAFHMKRAVISFQDAGIPVTPIPASFKSWPNRQYGWNDYLPGKFTDVSNAAREYLGLLFYALT
jgi:uncharacterized SAM-binding protein YcdF (DUF218 family)